MAAILEFFGLRKPATSSTQPQEPLKTSKWNNKVVATPEREGFESPASALFKKQQKLEKAPTPKEHRTYSLSSSGSFDFDKMGFPNPNTLGSSSEGSDPDLKMYLRSRQEPREDFTSLPADFDRVNYQRRSSNTSSSSLTPEEPRKKSPELPIAKRKAAEPKPFTGETIKPEPMKQHFGYSPALSESDPDREMLLPSGFETFGYILEPVSDPAGRALPNTFISNELTFKEVDLASIPTSQPSHDATHMIFDMD
ncbi:MAG: hypothetical protein KF898_10790 [Parachlamydiales bacterium]|nr:hypothetical protein [Verrucomicrobiota bacterium]MBX3720124.1 hypothetical protein [Candidatus Acheromyda pituitae]